jgi:nitrogenase molybdenum-iron protein NifN
MRRYIISHFREPIDIASSSLGEKHAVYGGGPNLKQGLKNVMTKYGARVVGVATTCLTETIGDDVPMIVGEFRREMGSAMNGSLPQIITVSTPSYSGTHMEGFHAVTKAAVDQMAHGEERVQMINLLPGFLSPEDLRYLAEIFEDFCCAVAVLPDYSATLDGPALDSYEKIPRGGTPVEEIRLMGGARATVEFGRTLFGRQTAGELLNRRFRVPLHQMGIPVGLRETDHFIDTLENLTGSARSNRLVMERGRLLDSYVDAHKYLFGKKVVVYGEEDLVVGLTSFFVETGLIPVLCASGGRSGRLQAAMEEVTGGLLAAAPLVKEGLDFQQIEELSEKLSPDLMVGHSKGYTLAGKLGVPLVRVGFPIHDRFGGQRILHTGYRGAQMLLDRIVNALLEKDQEDSTVGYAYM